MGDDMQCKLDLSKKYAIALEGGGAKGAYEIGVWKALEEAGVQYEAVSGASVGALNGALMAMKDLQTAEKLWENITFSQVIDVDDTQMKAFFDGCLHWSEWPDFLRDMIDVIQNGGFDTEPLEHMLEEVIDEEKIRKSDVDFFLVTYSLTDQRELDLDAKTLEDGALHDMLLASAFFPAFKQKKLRGKYYTDGGLPNVLPIDSLLSRGYRDIIVIRIYGIGFMKKVEIPEDANIIEIGPTQELCNVLQFDEEYTRRDMQLGYYDGQRFLYGLAGESYYIDRKWSEEKAYGMLCMICRAQAKKSDAVLTLREINEKILPKLAKKMKAKGNYYDLWIKWMESQAKHFDISPFAIYTEDTLWQAILQKQIESETK